MVLRQLDSLLAAACGGGGCASIAPQKGGRAQLLQWFQSSWASSLPPKARDPSNDNVVAEFMR